MKWMGFCCLLLSAACVLDTPVFEGKECPCEPESGFECIGGVCVVSSDPGCDAEVTITGFRASWATSNVIRWEWDTEGDPTNFVSYELTLRDESSGDETVFGPDSHPDLSGFYLRQTGTGMDEVDGTLTIGLTQSTTYSARLRAVTQSCQFDTDFIMARTIPEPPRTLRIFDDAAPAGASPSNFEFVEDGAGGFMEWFPDEDIDECVVAQDDAEVCTGNLQLYFAPGPHVSADITQGNFAGGAYVEYRLRYDGQTPSNYSRMWLVLRKDDESQETFEFYPHTVGPADEFRTYQVPLTALFSQALGRMIAYEDLHAALRSFNAGGQWDRGTASEPEMPASVRIDDVVIRY